MLNVSEEFIKKILLSLNTSKAAEWIKFQQNSWRTVQKYWLFFSEV